MTGFEHGLSKPSSFSDASRIAEIAVDPEMMQWTKERPIDGSSPDFPPVLTPGDYASQYFVRSDDTLTRDQEDAIATAVRRNLIDWAREGFFDIVPLPGVDIDDKLGFRITSAGIAVAQEAFQRNSTRLRKLGQTATTE